MTQPDIQRVSAATAYHLMNLGYVCLDVRTPEEYAKGHPVAALNLPLAFYAKNGGFRDNGDFLRVAEVLEKSSKIIVIGKIGKRSHRAAELLVQAGFRNVRECRPGMIGLINATGGYDENGYRTLGLPEEKETFGGSYEELRERAEGLCAA